MSTFPPLTHWSGTAHGLHRAAQPLGALRVLALDPVPNYLELSLTVGPDGLSTGPLPGIGEVVLNLQEAAVVYHPPSGEPTTIPLVGSSQASLLETLLAAVDANGWEPLARRNGSTSLTERLLALLARRDHPFGPKPEDLTDGGPLEIDPWLSADYGRTLYRIFTASARFRARLAGPMTPIVVWPEHFDLSFLWFGTSVADDRHPHMNFGFAPFGDDIDRPYLYAYAYPMPEGFEHLGLPPRARWHTAGWQGIVYLYDDLLTGRDGDDEAIVEEFYAAAYRLLAPSLRAATVAG